MSLKTTCERIIIKKKAEAAPPEPRTICRKTVRAKTIRDADFLISASIDCDPIAKTAFQEG